MKAKSSALLAIAFALQTGCADEPHSSDSGGTSPVPGECESKSDCDPTINPCYIGACSALLHRCLFKPNCLTPSCNSGECPAVTEYSGKVACDDGDPLTADRCVDATEGCGACSHVDADCDHYDSAEIQLALCDDEDECTSDRCGDDNACIHSPIANCAP